MAHTSELRVGALLYLVGARTVHGIFMHPDGRRDVFGAGACADVQPHVAALMAALDAGVAPRSREAEFARFVEGWGQDLLPQGLATAELDVLVVVPHHFLHGVPIHALHLNGVPIAMQLGITYCSSIELVGQTIGRNPARSKTAGWEFLQSSHESLKLDDCSFDRACVTYGGDVVAGLSRYREVASLFAAHFSDAMELTPWSVNRSQLKMFPRDRVVCVVSHGFVDETTPELSGLLVEVSSTATMSSLRSLTHEIAFIDHDFPICVPPLKDQPDGGRIEVLTALELAVAKSPVTELACLFGCSTARGEPLAFDDVATVAHQWLKSGAGSVLASMWELDVEHLALWVPQFLESWIGLRQPKAIAWREATRSLLQAHPETPTGLWASMVLLGDWL